MKRLVLLGLVLIPSVSAAQGYASKVSGWTLSDTGRKPGDDSGRSVSIEKSVPGISLLYGPNGKGNGGSFRLSFAASKGCKARTFYVGTDFGVDKAASVADVRNEINGAFAEFREGCPRTSISSTALLTGFDEAFAAVHKQVADKPYIFSSTPDAGATLPPQSKSQGQ